jgi:hypothetical protein
MIPLEGAFKHTMCGEQNGHVKTFLKPRPHGKLLIEIQAADYLESNTLMAGNESN